ncbi:hypothetical protein J4Q44_G00048590 [Coregonus suidteri]|uniref:Uncharacterized protein n=1 Tax=Coregonus suidteri TaxID=861788 RepID=A0AAN8MGN9_9TELE
MLAMLPAYTNGSYHLAVTSSKPEKGQLLNVLQGKQPNISKSDFSNHIVGLLQYINYDGFDEYPLCSIRFVECAQIRRPSIPTVCIPLTSLPHLLKCSGWAEMLSTLKRLYSLTLNASVEIFVL